MLTVDDDQLHMRRALRLAARGRGRVSPNPMVGAVIVDDSGQVLGEGYHQQIGGPHAEAHALAVAGDRARGSTLYCTLEPCTVDGRTPPCADAVAAAGIRRLVCALPDPDPRVRGRGFEQLRQAGVEVDVGTGACAASELLAAYLHHRRTGRAMMTLKLGQTLDGRIATGAGISRWITGTPARRHAHRWRSWVDGIMVGAGTVLADDPALTVRHVTGQNPRPIVIDGGLRCVPSAQVFSGREPKLVTTAGNLAVAQERFGVGDVEIWGCPDHGGIIDLRQVAARCGAAGLTQVIVEGGRTLAAAALAACAIDDVMIYVAPRFLGGDAMAAIGDLGITQLQATPQLTGVRTRRLGEDLLVTGKVAHACSQD
ncbi:MAG: bifunctional diaminohydroxyphosphoribosylaminopyrimidine deaminase/5-amino-6-(5-phosphoribosylamino)uracil reductase RibD [Gemmatimonadetes bacterium]|nr:bifunctional diaminohydroxyphosphoribosylaminopyrimidine deaminase/5-amino-6-(5-phosphoribosylamino)uracil reductase RibD [Gemmatimonadota bacterium]